MIYSLIAKLFPPKKNFWLDMFTLPPNEQKWRMMEESYASLLIRRFSTSNVMLQDPCYKRYKTEKDVKKLKKEVPPYFF